jgi:serine/threonine-protein kinase
VFGFLWLIFKMIFFTALVMGLGVGAGYAILWWYIKTPEVTVPNVRGMKIAEAFEVLSDKKLGMVKVRSESSGLVAPGEIVEQSPSAGSTYKQGRAVGVVISSGRSKFTVPNVVGESIENARNKIRGANLEVGNELRMEDPSVPKEAVISQQPTANTGLDEAAKVDLLVSSGPPGKGLTMPNVTGVTFGQAKAALSRLGITDIATDPANQSEGTVISQDPLVGKTILQSDHVTLHLRK